MAKRTKTELIQIRETTYKPPEIPERRCETCRWSWGTIHGRSAMTRCEAVEVRGEPVRKIVHYFGVCDLYEAKEASDGK